MTSTLQIAHTAVCNGDLDTLRSLVESGELDLKASMNQHISWCGISSYRLVYEAIARNHLDIVQYLGQVAPYIFDTIYNNGIGTTWTLLTDAIRLTRSGDLHIVRYLVERMNMSLHFINQDGETVFLIACEYGGIDMIRYLVEERHYHSEQATFGRRTPLSVACMSGNTQVLRYLIEELNYSIPRDLEHGRGLFHIACEYGNIDTVAYLANVVGISTQDIDVMGRTPFTYACIVGNLNVVQYLAECLGFDVEKFDDYWQIPLYVACANGHLDIVRYLCEVCHCDPEAREFMICTGASICFNYTPFMGACIHGLWEIAEYLAKVAHVNTRKRTFSGYSIYDLCTSPDAQFIPLNMEELHTQDEKRLQILHVIRNTTLDSMALLCADFDRSMSMSMSIQTCSSKSFQRDVTTSKHLFCNLHPRIFADLLSYT